MEFTQRLTICLLSFSLLMSCDSQPVQSNNASKSNNGQIDASGSDKLRSDKVSAEFICSHLLIKTDLIGDNLTLTVEDKSYQLSQTPSASGNKYENQVNNISFWQKTDGASLEFNGQQYSNCQKVNIQRPDIANNQLKLPFIARGNEPGWLLNINKRQFELTTDYGNKTVNAAFSSQPLIKVGQTFQLETDNEKLALLVNAKLCHDSMSGMPYPYTVAVDTEQQSLLGCGGEPRALLTKNPWSVLTIADNMLSENSRISLNFNSEMQLAGVASCNRYTTSYNLTGESLSISPIATTQMACEPLIMEQEASFLKYLANVSRFDLTEDGQLVLYTSQGVTIVAQPQMP